MIHDFHFFAGSLAVRFACSAGGSVLLTNRDAFTLSDTNMRTRTCGQTPHTQHTHTTRLLTHKTVHVVVSQNQQQATQQSVCASVACVIYCLRWQAQRARAFGLHARTTARLNLNAAQQQFAFLPTFTTSADTIARVRAMLHTARALAGAQPRSVGV